MAHRPIPPPPEILINALSKEKNRQIMEERSSKDRLIDEEGIALKDLSSQRSPIVDPRQSTLQNPFVLKNDTDKVVRRGWRRSTTGDDLSKAETLTMGKIYKRMGRLSIIPRYFVYIFPLGLLIAIPIVIGAIVPKLELGVMSLSSLLIIFH